MKGKVMGLLVTGLIILVFVAISWRVPFLKKIVYGA
jgi:hypothetical protein